MESWGTTEVRSAEGVPKVWVMCWLDWWYDNQPLSGLVSRFFATITFGDTEIPTHSIVPQGPCVTGDGVSGGGKESRAIPTLIFSA